MVFRIVVCCGFGWWVILSLCKRGCKGLGWVLMLMFRVLYLMFWMICLVWVLLMVVRWMRVFGLGVVSIVMFVLKVKCVVM